jgi:two-component system catabolic regulation response regulator CreB
MSQSRILVVEDEPAIAETILYALKTEGFVVTHCETGGDGLAEFRTKVPDFIVLDVGLPDITGFEVCREIRKTSDVPILFLTAREGEIDRVVGLEIGADDYVIKPFSPRELTARINAILRRTSSRGTASRDSADEVIPNRRLELLMERYLAKLDGKDLDLSRYEFGMLRIFMKHPGRVYSRDQLMELVWDEPEAALDRTVDAHIKTLRRKLHEIDSDFDPIRTHRGIGYSFSDD